MLYVLKIISVSVYFLLLPIRSNHNEIKRAINFFNRIKFNIINENIQINDTSSEKLIDLDIVKLTLR